MGHMARATKWVLAAVGAAAFSIIALGVLVALSWLPSSPEGLDAAPLHEVVGDLEQVRPPTEHCPESADECWASVVVASGESQAATIAAVKANADRAGFVPSSEPSSRWTVERRRRCLSLHEPGELLVYDRRDLPSDAMYVGLDRC